MIPFPHRYGNLYPLVCAFENLHSAYLKARRNKRYRQEVLSFSSNLEENLIQIQNELIQKTYQTGKYRKFYVYEPKERLVRALPFKDRVVQHALNNIIEPIFEKTFIYDSYACRRGRGTHAGADRVTHFLQVARNIWPRIYCLKGDVSKYFPSIDHAILMGLIKRRIKCPDTLWLITEILASSPDATGPRPKGIPVGNLTSQLFANVYLNELDHFIKQELKCKFYVRYMDDFVILAPDKKVLHAWKKEIADFLEYSLALELNGKTSIFPVSQGIDFLGYRLWATHRLVRKGSIKRMKRKLKRFKQGYTRGTVDLEKIKRTLASWLGHVGHADSYNLRKKLLDEFVLIRGD
ncbi:MAG: reverse transcriptase/maturase family protein [Desulfitobacteriaceae bacterium]|nr:reverse transcriptase/maturase family protein [Desulfitobacteriaceae bacterium]